MRGLAGWLGGRDWIIRFSVCAAFKDDMLERFGVGQALGGVMVEGDGALKLLRRRRQRFFRVASHRTHSGCQIVYRRAFISSGAVNFRLAMYVEVFERVLARPVLQVCRGRWWVPMCGPRNGENMGLIYRSARGREGRERSRL